MRSNKEIEFYLSMNGEKKYTLYRRNGYGIYEKEYFFLQYKIVLNESLF